MRPRLIGRGFISAPPARPREASSFNEAASDRTRICGDGDAGGCAGAASMRPRLIGRGFQGGGSGGSEVSEASMRPRLIGRGFIC